MTGTDKTAPKQDIATAQAVSDPLIESLEFLAAYYGRPRSAAALMAGLPTDGGRIKATVFATAATRAGLQAETIKQKPSQLTATQLPAVVLRQDGGCDLLLAAEKGKTGQVLDRSKLLDALATPLRPPVTVCDLSVLDAAGNGFVIVVKPQPETVAEEDSAHGGHWFWQPLIESSGVYGQVLIASVMINLFALTSPLFMMNFYNRVLPNDALETGWVLVIGAVSVFVFDFIVKTLRGYFIDTAGHRADVLTGQRLYDQVLDMRLGGRPESIGVFASRLREFDSLREFCNSATMTALVDLPFALLFVAAIWIVASPQMALLLLGLYILVLAFAVLTQVPVRRKVRLAMQTAEKKHGLLVETLAATEMVRGVGGEGSLRARHARYLGASAEAGQASRFYSALSVNFSGMIQQLSGVLIVLIGMYLVRDKEMTAGALIACVLLASRVISPVGSVAALVNKYHQARVAFRQLDALMRLPVERPANRKFLHRPTISGAFAMNNVSFSYAGTTHKALENISFSVRAGEKVAVVGRIGSGKTTLVKMLVDFYQPTQGSVLVDGTDMRQVDPADLRRHVAYMGQDTGLLSGTVRDNITLGRMTATDEDILRVAEMTGVHEFIRRHPQGYDAPVGEGGTGLSGGQRQAVALARTLLMDTPVLVLDEPTNAMDSGSEERVLRALESHLAGRNLFLVTHKPALLRLVDRIIVIENGRIAMDGPRDQVWQALAGGQVAVTPPTAKE